MLDNDKKSISALARGIGGIGLTAHFILTRIGTARSGVGFKRSIQGGMFVTC